MAKQLVVVGNRVVAHGEDCFISMGGTVICPETDKAYQNATVVIHEGGLPADIDTQGYEYHAGRFVPCAPYGKGKGNILVACEECGTPKDSGVKAHEVMPGKVGDILVSARTDLGENWLLCNGEAVDGAEYPDLYGMLSLGLGKANGPMKNSSNELQATQYQVVYGNGYWVAMSVTWGGVSIKYTTTFTPDIYNWTGKSIANSSGTTQIKFLNGLFVISGGATSGSDFTAGRIYYASDPTGTWVTCSHNLAANSTYPKVNSVWYENGIWYSHFGNDTAGSGNSHGWAYLVGDVPDGTWVKLGQGGYNGSPSYKPYSIVYGKGVWVRSYYNGSNIKLSYSTDGKTWGDATTPRSYTSGGYVVYDGQKFVGLAYYSNAYYVLESEDGITWGDHAVTGLTANAPVFYIDGVYMFGNSYTPDASASALSPIVLNGAQLPATINSQQVYGYDGNTVVVCPYYFEGRILPSISIAGAYTYIKAKED